MTINDSINHINIVSNNIKKKVVAEINLAHLRYNLAQVKERVGNTKIMSVIKANAYGHGVFPIAEALQASDIFAVARFGEALELRYFLTRANIDRPILILEGVSSVNEIVICSDNNLIPNIHCLEQFEMLKNFFKQYSQRKLDYWLKADTGMHRLGFLNDDWTEVLKEIKSLDKRYLPTGIMSHFACADEIESPFNQQQLSQFKTFYTELEKLTSINKSLANSAAILSLAVSHFDWVRPGIMLYGVSPFETSKDDRTGLDEKLKPVMTLSSEIIAIKKLKQGDCIGYGSTWCCPENMYIGVIAIGYGDGYPRHAEPGTPVLIHGVEVPLVGRVSMDMITVDLRYFFHHNNKAIETIHIGDKVVLWGEGLAIEKISKKSTTISYELLCNLTQRVSFKYIDNLTEQI